MPDSVTVDHAGLTVMLICWSFFCWEMGRLTGWLEMLAEILRTK